MARLAGINPEATTTPTSTTDTEITIPGSAGLTPYRKPDSNRDVAIVPATHGEVKLDLLCEVSIQLLSP